MMDRVADYAPLILRLGLSTIFILQGAIMVSHMGRSPSASHIIVMVIQLLGGLFCLIGFWTRWAAFALAMLMLYRMVDGYGFRHLWDPDHQLLFAGFIISAAAFCLGGGKYSIDESQRKKKEG